MRDACKDSNNKTWRNAHRLRIPKHVYGNLIPNLGVVSVGGVGASHSVAGVALSDGLALHGAIGMDNQAIATILSRNLRPMHVHSSIESAFWSFCRHLA